MKIFLVLLFIFCGFQSSRAEEPATPIQNRVLFVVEKSSAMSRSANAAQEAVAELIGSGMQGQMREGDTFGLWTFNENLDTGFPMQQWSSESKKKLAVDVLEYLRKNRYEKKGQIKTVLPPLYSVIKSSHAITVVLISSGREPIQGTPFDQKINEVYKLYESELEDAKLPFVTVLVGRLGRPVAYSVNSSLRIQIPDLRLPTQSELPETKTNVIAKTDESSRTTEPAAPKPRIAQQNIIISGPTITNRPSTTDIDDATNAAAAGNPGTEIKNPISNAPVAATNQAAKVETLALSEPPAVAQTTIQTQTQEKTPGSSAQPLSSKSSSNAASSVLGIDDPSNFKPEPQTIDSSSNRSAPKYPDEIMKQNHGIDPGPASAIDSEPVVPLVAAETIHSPKKFLLIAVSLVCVAGLLLFFLIRSSRGKSEPSLISRSIDQSKK